MQREADQLARGPSQWRQRVASDGRTARRGPAVRRAGSRFCPVGWFIPVPKCTRNWPLAVVIRLTEDAASDNLKYMSRFIFAAWLSLVVSSTAAAQQVPGRDLFDFPLGLLGDPAPLSSRMAGSLWNPATSNLLPGRQAEFGFAGLTTPKEQGVRLQMLGGTLRVYGGVTASLSYAQASVSDILRTETDPQSLGGEVPYGTSLLSAGASKAHGNVTAGVAVRYRWAALDADRSGVFATDAGVLIDGIARTPLRIAFSTFLMSPSRSKEVASYLTAADGPLYRRDSTFVIRGGYSMTATERRGREDYVFTTTTYRQFDLSAGVAQATAYGNRDHRWRLGLGFHYGGYTAAFGREDGAAGVGASTQFLLTRMIR
jgi:hypothetical protein